MSIRLIKKFAAAFIVMLAVVVGVKLSLEWYLRALLLAAAVGISIYLVQSPKENPMLSRGAHTIFFFALLGVILGALPLVAVNVTGNTLWLLVLFTPVVFAYISFIFSMVNSVLNKWPFMLPFLLIFFLLLLGFFTYQISDEWHIRLLFIAFTIVFCIVVIGFSKLCSKFARSKNTSKSELHDWGILISPDSNLPSESNLSPESKPLLGWQKFLFRVVCWLILQGSILTSFAILDSLTNSGHIPHLLGEIYEQGYVVKQDDEQAAYWYTKSAEQGNTGAQVDLGYLYEVGKGVSQSYEQAVYWYTKSAEQGNARAQVNLGYLYDAGEGVSQSYEQAVYWYTKSAEQGNARAQNNLGSLYEYGDGVTKSLEQAAYWYRKSAEQGNARAQGNLERLGLR